ncbi:MAG: TetR/AcrR family transcriptional regulator [Anaerolineae bacterium]
MPRRAGLTHTVVVNAAIELINQDGAGQLSLAALAQKLNVRSPSLYNHINGLDGLRRDITLVGLRQLTAALQTAVMGRAGFEALASLAQAYRHFALSQPGLYALTLRSTEQDDPELQQAGRDAVAVVLAALRGYGLEGDAALHATRCLRSALHGFVSLEMAGGFALTLDLDESFGHLLRTLDCGLTSGFGR